MRGERRKEREREKEREVPCRRRDIPAGRARRQNNKTKDAGGGRRRSEGRIKEKEERDLSGKNERRKREWGEETKVGEIGPCDRAGWGRAVLQWMLRRTKRTKRDEGYRETVRKGGNRTGMHGRMRRVTGYPTATLILRENERVLIRISFLHRLDRTIRTLRARLLCVMYP